MPRGVFVRTPKMRANMSAAAMGNTNGLGYQHTLEAKAKMSRAKIAPIGSTRRNRDGYQTVKVADHPSVWEFEHRLVMEKHLGRPLYHAPHPNKGCVGECEHVHHIDGDVVNNDITNLELLMLSEHSHLPRASSVKGN